MLFQTGVEQWFARTKYRPLTLVLKVSMPSRGVSSALKEEFGAVLSYIADNADRFRLISVMDDRDHQGNIFTPPGVFPTLWGEKILQIVNEHTSKFTLLTSFDYRRTYYVHTCPLLNMMDPPFQLPQTVRKFELIPGPTGIARSISPIPTLQNVQHLDLRGYSLSPCNFLKQLAFTPLLITGAFTIFGNNDLPPMTTPIRLERIRHLTLFPMMQDEDLEFLGTHINELSQTLAKLSIDGIYKPYPTLPPLALIPHRGDCLSDLTLMNLKMNADDLHNILSGCPGLLSLYLRLPSVRETEIVGTLQRTNYEPESLEFLPVLNKFTIVIFMDCHDYIPDFFEDMIKSRRNETLLRDSSCLIQVVNLIHLGVGEKPEVDQLKESLQDLRNVNGFVLNIEGPKDIHEDVISTPPRSGWFY